MHFIRSRTSVSNYKMHITKISTRFFFKSSFLYCLFLPTGSIDCVPASSIFA